MDYVILGGGITGTTAAEELRKIDANAEITIIEQEANPCYSRVLLPHYVKGVVTREKVFLKRADWYETQRITLQANVRAERIDTVNKFVATSEGREIPYDKLLIASGGDVNLAPTDPRGVSYLHSLDDADHLLALLAEVRTRAKAAQQAVVFGGGFIALEYINIFAHYALPTTVVMRGSGFWSRVLSAHSQSLLRRHAEAHGVTMHTEQQSITFVGEKALEGVEADGKHLPAAIAGVGIGIHADTTLCTDAGIACGNGIIADGQMRTNVQGVYTAGDVAEFAHPLLGRQLQVGNWLNALMQGRAVAKAMAGQPITFDLVTSYATQLLGVHVVFIGDTERAAAHEVQQNKADDTSSIELFLRDGRIVGAVMIGDIAPRAAITKAIQEKRSSL